MIRKTLFCKSLFFSAMALFTGCNQEELSLNDNPSSLMALIEGGSTRVSIDEAGKFAWTEGDEIAVHYSDGTYSTATVHADGTVAGISSTSSRYRDFYAIYPATSAVVDNSILKVTFPSSYDVSSIIENSDGTDYFDYSPMVMVAINRESDGILDFYHVGALLRISLKDLDPATKTVQVTFDKDVTGTYEITYPHTLTPLASTLETSENNVVTFTVASSSSGIGANAQHIVLNLPLPCGVYTHITVETFNGSGILLDSMTVDTFDDEPMDFSRCHARRFAFGDLSYICRGLNDVSVEFTGYDSSASLASRFKSYKTDGITSEIVPFRFEFSENAEGPWRTTAPDWLHLVDGVSYAGSIGGQPVNITMDLQDNITPDEHTLALRNAEERDLDLSYVRPTVPDDSPGGWNNPASTRSTANCYIVKAPGTYRFPLVYGNALVDGQVNQSAYRCVDRYGGEGAYLPDEGYIEYSTTSDGVTYITHSFLGRFHDHLDGYIRYHFISTQHSTKKLDAVLMWEDAPGLITDVSVNGHGNGAYISFTVPKQRICQGNAMIAVLTDEDGDNEAETIAWSWHVWVTDQSMVPLPGPSYGGRDFDFAPLNLGWCEGRTDTYPTRTCYVRAFQPGSGKASDPVLVTEQGEVIETGDNNCYYNTFRKDPVLAGDGKNGYLVSHKKYYSTQEKYKPLFLTEKQTSNDYSIGKMIRHPNYVYTFDSFNYQAISYNPMFEQNIWNSDHSSYRIPNTYRIDNYMPLKKTVYDPSPVGFIVPPVDAFRGFTLDNSGWDRALGLWRCLENDIVFPPTGAYRNSMALLVSNLIYNGTGGNDYFMFGPENFGIGGYGYAIESVRCITERCVME